MYKSKLLQALKNQTRKFEADLEDSHLFKHYGDRGEFRERIVEKFLRPFLPECYGLGSGEIFSTENNESNQIDVVIYDSIFSNVLFRYENNSLFPCESVYGTIEVKSNLSTEALNESLENIASVKRLRRKDSDMLDFLPIRRINTGQGLTYDKTPRNPYLGIVFAYDGLTAENVEQQLNRLVTNENTEKQYLPDFIFSYKKQFMIARFNPTVISDFDNKQITEEDMLALSKAIANQTLLLEAVQKGWIKGTWEPARLGEKFCSYKKIDLGDNILPLFFLTINTCLNQIHLKSLDHNQYWIQVFNQAINPKLDS